MSEKDLSKMKMTYSYRIHISLPKVTITGEGFDDLFQKVKDHFNQQNMRFNEVSIRSQIFVQNHLNEGYKEATDQPFKKKININSGPRISLAEALKGASATLKTLGSNTCATNDEIRRRSMICANCAEKTSVSDCMSCGGAGKIASLSNKLKARFGKQTLIPEEIKKLYCRVCKCSLAVMVLTKYHDLEPESEQKQAMRPDHCWLKTTSPNFTKQ